jgi:integrase
MMIAIDPANVRAMRATAFRLVHLTGAAYVPGSSPGVGSRGISSTVLAKLMGHESSAITEKVYVHLFDRIRTDEVVREAMSYGPQSRH